MRLRTASQHTPIRHQSKPHCRQDLACAGYCSCVEQLKNQNKILKEKVERLTKENQQKQKMMIKLTKRIIDFEKRKEEFDKIDDFKAKVRESIKIQLEQQKNAEDYILKQRIANAKKEKQTLLLTIQKMTRDSEQRERQLNNLKRELRSYQQKASNLEEELSRKKKEDENIHAKLNDLNEKNQHFDRILQQKTQAINRIKNALSQAQQHFITEKIKAKNNQFQSIRHQQDLKTKAIEINSLHKTTQQKNNSINHLNAEKEKLGRLVAELDSTVHSYSHISNQLRERICISEDYALQKEIQYKQLEMDYYDTVHQRYL